MSRKPVVGVIGNAHRIENRFAVQAVGERNLRAVAEVAGALPLMFAGCSEITEIAALLDVVDGIVLTGAPEQPFVMRVEQDVRGGALRLDGTMELPGVLPDPLGITGLDGRKKDGIEGFPILNVTGYGNFGDIGIRPLEQFFTTLNFADTFATCWKLGQSELPENARRFDALQAERRRG